jgi:signal transduction histidine kinase
MSTPPATRPGELTVPAPRAAPASPLEERGRAEQLARRVLLGSPLGRLAHWVARIRASVHVKLLCAFLLITLLLLAMGVMSLETIARMSRQSRLLDEGHARVDLSRQIEHALAMQMNFTAMALLLRDEVTIAKILRENNRFNSTLASIEEAAAPEERETIQRIRLAQEQVLITVADIANLIRDRSFDEAMALQLSGGYPLYEEIAGLVDQVVGAEQRKMERLRASVAAAQGRAPVLIGAFAAASVLLALLLGFVISWSFILPVREAYGFLTRLAKGDFSSTVTVPNRDEFGLLADRMNAMSQELRTLYDDQRAASEQLRVLNDRLERASKAKSDFLASMSHELRTPLNAILGFTELILDDTYGALTPRQRQPLGDIQTNGRHLLRLINDVLDLSKIEAGRMELSSTEYAVADVVSTVRASLGSLAAEKGLALESVVPDDLPPAYGDAKRITQCLLNLVGNALKFTAGGRVQIRVARDGPTLCYAVADTGIGIPADRLEGIFDEFRQADATVAREFGGTGLGLSITRRFVELHGGRIWAESQPGQGSTFFFTVPLRVAGEAER